MGYRVSGILKLPDGTPANNAEIEFISRKNFSPLVQELKSNIRCSATGAYDVTLEYGEYAVIVYPGGTYPAALGTIILAADTVAGQDLPTLLQQAGWQPATPEYIQQIAAWLADANASAASSAASASAANVSEINSKASEIAAEADRSEVAANTADVRVKHSDVVAKSAQVSIDSSATQAAKSTAVSAADTASQKAASAAQSEATASSAATRAEQAAQAVAGALIDAGAYDASTGVLPAPTQVAGVNKSCIWKVTGAGAAGGIELGVGDSLIYTTHSASYYKIDNTESVTSVNGQKGIVSLTASNVGADAAGTAAAAVLDAERRAVERASGGQQTVIYDAAGNANVMFVLPRFTYADLGMTADMGTGDVTAFDFGSGSIKSEIFIGAYLASGSGAVSAPRQDPLTSLDHTAARNACSAKGAGWHLMTVHEWAAIALWCMANGYEPIGNTNWGSSHVKTWMVGDRADNRAPGDTAGTGRTQTGSMGYEATHDRTLGGIADLVGNVWEWQDGLLLQGGQIKASTHNTQPEANWALQAAFFDAPSSAPVLSNAITRAASVSAEWKSVTKSASYVSNPLLKRLLIEPASALPSGWIYTSNEGEQLPFRGGVWYSGTTAGLAALFLSNPRVAANTGIGFRPAFA